MSEDDRGARSAAGAHLHSSAVPLLIALILIAAINVYGPFLGDFFWLDDVAWIHGPALAEQPVLTWALVPNGLYPYRPLAAGLFALLGPLLGCLPWAYRLAGLGLHLANIVLVFALARRLIADDGAALAGAALWAVYPTQRWAVLWIADLAGLLATFWLLVAFLAFGRARRAPGRAAYVLALGAFALACLAKETALAAVVLFPLVAALAGPAEPAAGAAPAGRPATLRRALARGTLARYAPFAAVALLAVAPVASAYLQRPGEVPFDPVSWRLPANLARALLFLVMPLANPNAINVRTNPEVVLIGALVALPWLVGLALARSRRAWLLGLWAPLALLPVLLHTFVLLPFNARYLYLPALGYCLLLALAWRGGARVVQPALARLAQRAARPGLALAPAGLFVIALAGLGAASASQQWWVRNPSRPSGLYVRVAWSGLQGCPLTPEATRAALAREGIAPPQEAADLPLPERGDRFYFISLVARALAREGAGDPARARDDLLAARALALQGDLDSRDHNSGYWIAQDRLLAYLETLLTRVDAGPPP
jgi:hypothetical protein